MKYEQAKEIGLECGLEKPYEFVNNVRMHCFNLFAYSEIRKELEELYIDSKPYVIFSEICGDAIKEGESAKELCYICKALRGLEE